MLQASQLNFASHIASVILEFHDFFFGSRVFRSSQQSHETKVQDIAVMQQLQL